MLQKANPIFKKAVTKFWRSLLSRHNGKSQYGPCPITRAEFAEWLLERSMGGEGYVWKCEYTGNVLQLMARTQAGRLTIDHKVPLAKGGTSTLDNLAICSEEANKVKGSLCVGFYGRLMNEMAKWPPEERDEVVRRLKGWRGWKRGR